MTDAELRAIVRDAVARHLGARAAAVPLAVSSPPVVMVATPGSNVSVSPSTSWTLHPSHYRYTLAAPDGTCVIEPAVSCDHCGYCKSHGH
jgi:hypothetical protein